MQYMGQVFSHNGLNDCTFSIRRNEIFNIVKPKGSKCSIGYDGISGVALFL